MKFSSYDYYHNGSTPLSEAKFGDKVGYLFEKRKFISFFLTRGSLSWKKYLLLFSFFFFKNTTLQKSSYADLRLQPLKKQNSKKLKSKSKKLDLLSQHIIRPPSARRYTFETTANSETLSASNTLQPYRNATRSRNEGDEKLDSTTNFRSPDPLRSLNWKQRENYT